MKMERNKHRGLAWTETQRRLWVRRGRKQKTSMDMDLGGVGSSAHINQVLCVFGGVGCF